MALSVPELTAVNNDGTAISMSWKPVAGTNIEYGATLYSTDGSFSMNSPLVSGLSLSITATLDTTKQYEVRLHAYDENGTESDSTPTSVITRTTQLSEVNNSGTRIAISWPAGVLKPGEEYAAGVYATNGSASYYAPATTKTTATVDQALDTNKSYQAVVAITNGISSGPPSDPIDVIVEAPTLSQIAYNLTETTIQWDSLSINSVTYGALLYATDGSFSKNPLPTAGLSASVSQVLDNSKTYNAQVQAIVGLSSGPFSDPVEVITQQPVLNELSYNLTETTIKWDALSMVNVTYGAQLASTDGGYSDSPSPTTNLSVTIAEVLDDSKTYQAKVQAIVGISRGPFSEVTAVITQQPALTDLEYDDDTVTLKWGAVCLTGANYIATVAATDGSYQDSSPASSGLSAVIQHTLSDTVTYQGSCKVVIGISQGPESNKVDVLTSLPGPALVNYNGTDILASWLGDSSSGITGYEVSLLKDHTPKLSNRVTTTDTQFTQNLDPGAVFTVQVRSVAGISKGPLTAPGFAPFASNRVMAYDQQGRLTSVVDDGSWNYTYSIDPPGNITNMTVSK